MENINERIEEIAAAICMPQSHEEALLGCLCLQAQSRLQQSLPEDADWQAQGEALCCAAALGAAADLLDCRSAGNGWQSFRAGEVSVSVAQGNEWKKKASMLRALVRNILWPYEKDKHRILREVQG